MPGLQPISVVPLKGRGSAKTIPTGANEVYQTGTGAARASGGWAGIFDIPEYDQADALSALLQLAALNYNRTLALEEKIDALSGNRLNRLA